MTEKEKMLSEQFYNAIGNEELRIERDYCKDLCYEYNHLKPSQVEEQQRIIHKILGKIEGEICIMAPFWCDYGYNIEAGERLYINHNCVILDCTKVRFGRDVFVGPNCGFYTAGHPTNAKIRNTGLEFGHSITIGDDVWIGAHVCVLPGVKIGNNVVIAAGSVVNKDIPDGVLAAGNPCRVIRKLEENEK